MTGGHISAATALDSQAFVAVNRVQSALGTKVYAAVVYHPMRVVGHYTKQGDWALHLTVCVGPVIRDYDGLTSWLF